MKQIELANGKGFALVDDEDYEWLNGYKWHLSGRNGYARRGGKWKNGKHGPSILMHREVLGLNPSDKRQGDHINGNRLDNRRQNLRVCTHQENCHNVQKTKGHTSEYKGVSWDSQLKKWSVNIRENRINRRMGWFNDEIEAAIAYDWEARKLFGEFAVLNFPDIHRPAQGRIQLTPKGTSKYFGVVLVGRKWIAVITIQRETIYLGTFASEEDAARAFDDAARKYRGQNTRTNFHY